MVVAWVALLLGSLGVASIDTWERSVGSLLLICYALQGLVAEVLGVCVDEASISFPNRLLQRVPLFTLWRTTLPRKSFDRIDRAGERGVTIWHAGDPERVKLPSAETRKDFLSVCSKSFPHAKVSR